ncbi:MAG TPA: hypothetical protein VH253_09605 [Phycisphaerae bacterium]|nr:hypothetical protein [Phycisphaerae bacterium]
MAEQDVNSPRNLPQFDEAATRYMDNSSLFTPVNLRNIALTWDVIFMDIAKPIIPIRDYARG